MKILRRIGFVILAGVLVLSGLGLAGIGHVEEHATIGSETTPLFARRLNEMSAQFGTTPAAAAHGSPQRDQRQRQIAPEPQQAILWPSEAVSGCALSGCIGSACGVSECVGSACVASTCVGSACIECDSRPGAPDVMANVGGICPIDDDSGAASVRVTAFDVRSTRAGTEIRFAASGGDVERYRVYRQEGGSELDPVLVVEGQTSNKRMVRVLDRATSELRQRYGYRLELTDAYGRVTSVSVGPDPVKTATLQVGTAQSF